MRGRRSSQAFFQELACETEIAILAGRKSSPTGLERTHAAKGSSEQVTFVRSAYVHTKKRKGKSGTLSEPGKRSFVTGKREYVEWPGVLQA